MGYKILRKKELCANQYELTIHAPYITKNAKAGQFIILRVSEDGERIPLTIADFNREKGELQEKITAFSPQHTPPSVLATTLCAF